MGRPFYLPDSREVRNVLTQLGSDYPGDSELVAMATTYLGAANVSNYYYITTGLISDQIGTDHPSIDIVFFQDSAPKYIYTEDIGDSYGLNEAYVYNDPYPDSPPYPERQPMTHAGFQWDTDNQEYRVSGYQTPWSNNWNTPAWWGTDTEGYFLAINTELYVDDQSTDNAIDYFLTKGGTDPETGEDLGSFVINFGCGVNTDRAPHQEPTAGNSSDYYHSGKVECHLEWTSPVDHQSYRINANKLASFQYYKQEYTLHEMGEALSNIVLDYTTSEQFFNKKQTEVEIPYIEAYRSLNGTFYVAGEGTGLPDHPFSDYTNYRSFNSFTLGDLIRYYAAEDPTFTENDVYTTLQMKFHNRDLGVDVTKEIDYSSLYDSGIDPRTDDGKGDGEGSSWNPLPGHESDGSDPRLNPDPVNEIPLSTPTLSPIGVFNRTFILKGSAVKALSNLLSSTDDGVFDAIMDGLTLFGANPMNALIDLRLYPFDVAALPTISYNEKSIILGRYDTHITGNLMTTNSTAVLDLGSIYIKEKYHNFLDYEPYTKINLYIPYIGSIELPPSIYMNRTVSVRIIVDFITGAATAVVYCNGIPMIYQNGVMGISIAMTGDNAAQYSNGIIGNIVGAIGSAAGAVVSGVTGNIPGAVQGTVNAVTSGFDAINSINDVKFQQAGSNSPLCNTITPQITYVSIARPQKILSDRDDELNYGFVNGFATAEIKRVGEIGPGIAYAKMTFLGMGTPGTEPIPTSQEVDMIKQALNNGFYNTVM